MAEAVGGKSPVAQWEAVDDRHSLSSPPDRIAPPLVTTAPLQLNIHELGWDNFEKLVTEIVRKVEGREARRHGRPGQSQEGIDIVGFHPDAPTRVYQAKNYARFTAGVLERAVEKYASGSRPYDARELVIATSDDTSDTELLRVLSELRKKHTDLSIDLWGRQELSDMLYDHPRTVTKFFGPASANAFCRPAATASTEQNPLALEQLAAAGIERMVARWIAAGTEPATAVKFSQDPSLGDPHQRWNDIPPTGLTVIEGDFGSGKSLAVERLHAADIAAARKDPTAPIPVFLSARDVRADLGRAVREAAAHVGTPATRPVRAVLDGLDEPGPERSEDLLAQARALTAIHPTWRIIATARPGLRLTDKEQRICEPLSPEAVDALVDRLGGHPGALDSLSAEVRQALRRPLFTVIGAALQREDRRLPGRPLAFLEALAERGIRLSGRHESHARRLLTRLAAATVTGGGRSPAAQLGDTGDIETALATRLVVLRGRTLQFALPVLEQYFAGQAVLAGLLPDTVLTDPHLTALWRGGLALAIAAGDWDQGTNLVERLAARQPGAAAWIVHHAVPGNSDRTDDAGTTAPFLPDTEVTRRMQQAWDTWTTRLAPASGLLSGAYQGPLTIDARLDGGVLGAHLLRRDGDDTPALRIPAEHRWIEADRRHRPLQGWHGTVAADHGAWPWHWALAVIADRLTDLCSYQEFALPDSRPHTAERLWLTAKTLLARRNHDHAPLPADEVLAAVRSALRKHPDAVRIGYNNRLRTNPAELRHLEHTLEQGTGVSSDGMLHRPYAEPDAGEGMWIWGDYSPQQLHRLTQQVLTAAFEIYTALVTTWFPTLHDTLGLTARPIQIAGSLYTINADESPALVLRLATRAPGADPVDLRLYTGGNSGINPEDLRPVPEEPTTATGWARPRTTDAPISHPEVYGDTPAIDYAYLWLQDDLARLHLAKAPQSPGGL